MEYSKITLGRSSLPRIVEKTLTIYNEKAKTPSDMVDGLKVKSLLRVQDGQVVFVSKATNQYEKCRENELHLAVIGAEQEILKEELIEIARQTDLLANTKQEMTNTFTNYAKIFNFS
ncbi:MAG: hypothetical protein KGH65_00305 [Candidatus Micrarchaeota archaeon]|nr:hypothetical protein [Candidatus Micrarchaeota archaeon]